MPIIVPEGLSSARLLRAERIEVLHGPPRNVSTLRIALLNMTPDKTNTELQFARLLGATGRHVELVPALPQAYRTNPTSMELYMRWGERSLPPRLDGMIVIGAALDHMPFEDLAYWGELSSIFKWATSNVDSALYIGWAAFAALYMHHGVRPRVLPYKVSGVFQQQVMDSIDPLMAGLGAGFPCPVSRRAEVAVNDMPWRRGLTCLAQSMESGFCLVADAANSANYMFDHLEYDAGTLRDEYLRDQSRRAGTTVPQNYLPNDDIAEVPSMVWRRSAQTFFANWLTILAAGSNQVADQRRSAA